MDKIHRKHISDGMLNAYASGKRTATITPIIQNKGMVASKNRPKAARVTSAKLGAMLTKNRPQRIELVTGAHENNKAAKLWVLCSPSGNIYEFKNLANFIREHQNLFTAEELSVPENAGRFDNMAARGLRCLFMTKKDGRPHAKSWHGWTIGSKSC